MSPSRPPCRLPFNSLPLNFRVPSSPLVPVAAACTTSEFTPATGRTAWRARWPWASTRWRCVRGRGGRGWEGVGVRVWLASKPLLLTRASLPLRTPTHPTSPPPGVHPLEHARAAPGRVRVVRLCRPGALDGADPGGCCVLAAGRQAARLLGLCLAGVCHMVPSGAGPREGAAPCAAACHTSPASARRPLRCHRPQEAGLKVLLRPGPCENPHALQHRMHAQAAACNVSCCLHSSCMRPARSLMRVCVCNLVCPADICAEWDNGGFPHWFASSKASTALLCFFSCCLLACGRRHQPTECTRHPTLYLFSPPQVAGGRTMRMRTNDPAYLDHVDRWWGWGGWVGLGWDPAMASRRLVRPCWAWQAEGRAQLSSAQVSPSLRAS